MMIPFPIYFQSGVTFPLVALYKIYQDIIEYIVNSVLVLLNNSVFLILAITIFSGLQYRTHNKSGY